MWIGKLSGRYVTGKRAGALNPAREKNLLLNRDADIITPEVCSLSDTIHDVSFTIKIWG